ncbi:carboxylesterase family protein [Microbacterium binotii]|uniref:Carboxylic ester hydrolase n=1 Tax=Microbacterium binotii TaxID=462710 RepID=A0ABN3PEH0_9MICO
MTDPLATVSTGTLRGVRRPGSLAFLGIPFAAPPVDANRFAAPQPATPWDGVRDATAYGPTPQRGDTGITLIPEPSVPGDATLNVNVFTPDTDAAAPFPVLVWIHGGGYISGSPASPWYDGDTFAREGIVVVTLSYRLGFDGFGAIDGAVSNRGVRDWIAALEWVQQNIAAFGGDPARVTIGGQSAGGGAVLTLLGMPAAQHLFSAA